MSCRFLASCFLAIACGAFAVSGNRFTYLDENDPFYPNLQFPKLITPQWIGQDGVDAVVILAVDDMADTKRYEQFLRPILNRLKKIDGRAPVSIMTVSVGPNDPLVQQWLKEGLSLEVHTSKHPCPLLAGGNFASGASTYHQCVDLLSQIPGNRPVAFRMPCCDSMDSASPRFYAEIFNRGSPAGNFLTIDSSVMHRFTTNDTTLPRELVKEGRFAKYFPAKTNATTKVGLGAFATTIEDYPYPYVIGKLCWEFPCAAPSDWEAFNAQGAKKDQTVVDWKAALDATVLKQGVMTMVFHPHGWIRNDQVVELIDYAVSKYGHRIKFLNFREAQERLNNNLLGGARLRASDGFDNGVRLLDLNGDGFMDVMFPGEGAVKTRIWEPETKKWKEIANAKLQGLDARQTLRQMHFGFVANDPMMFFRDEQERGAWRFRNGEWQEDTNFFSGLNLNREPVLTQKKGRDRGVRLVDKNGTCEILVGNESQNAIFGWSAKEKTWKKLDYELPDGALIVNAVGEDNGVRFVDLNGDGYDDLLYSNEKGYGAYVFIAKPINWLGWNVGWSYQLRAGKPGESNEIPMIVRAGPYRNNGAWFKNGRMFVQNEDTAGLPDHIAQVSFDEISSGGEAPAKSPQEGLAAFHAPTGYTLELVASEPLVVDPVAIDWGPDGRMWVVEMRDYPLGIDGKGKPGGVVKYLEDTNGDGIYDKATVFLEGLRFPNGVMPWGKGVLITAAPDIIYAEDTDNDGKADVKKVLFTGFEQGNQQHRINGFEYGLDNWLYLANGGSGGVVKSVATGKELEMRGHDLRIRPDEGLMQLEPGQTQFGRHRNDWGDWFGNDNGRWAWHYYLPERYLIRNTRLAVGSMVRHLANYPEQNRLFPISPGQQRFNWPDALKEVTSACSATPYRDELFPAEFQHSLFVCEPANCLVHCEVLEDDGVSFTSHRATNETTSEFLASADNWCRPVMARTGPDGAVYVVDMYRKIIEHPEYFPEELKRRPDLRAGDDKGRIYRIYPVDAKLRRSPNLMKLDTAALVSALDSPNGWQRDTVQQLLVAGQDKTAIKPLIEMARSSKSPKARLQALATLDGLHAVDSDILLGALNDEHWAVRRHAALLSEPFLDKSPAILQKLFAMVNDPEIKVRYQLAFSLGESLDPKRGAALAQLALKDWENEEMRTAILSSSTGCPSEMLDAVFEVKDRSVSPDLVESLMDLVASSGNTSTLDKALRATVDGKRNPGPAQIAAVAGLLNELRHKKMSLEQFSENATPTTREAVQKFGPIFERARQVAHSETNKEPQRLMAIRLLGQEAAARTQDMALLGQLLAPQCTITIQNAALESLGRLSGADVADTLLAAWHSAGLTQRQKILNLLFSRQQWIEAVLVALEQQKLTAVELGVPQREKLLHHSNRGIRERATKVFASISSDRQKVVASYKLVTGLNGDKAHGHKLFVDTCSICHRLNDEGQPIGPDLGTMANKPVAELIVAILDPNQAVDPAYTSYALSTKDGRDFTGILAAETPISITLKLPGGAQETILRSNVENFRSQGKSLMPEGLESALKPQDLADVIAYVLSPK